MDERSSSDSDTSSTSSAYGGDNDLGTPSGSGEQPMTAVEDVNGYRSSQFD